MTAGSWILEQPVKDMCNDRKLFVELHNLEKPQEVTLGDGHDLDAIGRGVVVLETKLPSGRTKKCKLHVVLYVPKLSYNLLSVSKTSDAGKTTRFGEASCQIVDEKRKLIAVATRVGDLYYFSKVSHSCRQKLRNKGKCVASAFWPPWSKESAEVGQVQDGGWIRF